MDERRQDCNILTEKNFKENTHIGREINFCMQAFTNSASLKFNHIRSVNYGRVATEKLKNDA